MKRTLANTPASCQELLDKLEDATEVGFDTESAGPLLRNRKWKDGKTFINVHRSTMIGFSIAFPKPETWPANWLKKNGEPKKGKVLEPHAYYVPLFHNKGNASFAQAKRMLRMLGDIDTVWSHNVKHDFKTLFLENYRTPTNWYDTYLAAWLVRSEATGNGLKDLALHYLNRESPEFDVSFYNKTGAEALEYACHDAVNTLELGQLFRPILEEREMMEHLKVVESPFAVVLSEMEAHGMGVNVKKLRTISRDAHAAMEQAQEAWADLFPDIDIGSSHQLQELFAEGTWEPSGKTPGGAHKCDGDTMKHQLQVCKDGSAGHMAATLRLSYQQASKIATTYTLGFIEELQQFPDKRLHPDYRHLGAKTGRLSSANPNGQNIPVRSEWGKRVKAAFEPAPGFLYLAADYSQIELRVLAHLCGGKLLSAYVNDEDVHQQTADYVGIDRDAGKKLNFSVVYGAGPYLLAKQLGVTMQEASDYQAGLFQLYPEIPKVMSRLVKKADRRGNKPYIKTLTGRRVYVPELLSVDPKARASGVRKCGNAPIQGSAFDIMKIGMVNVRKTMIDDGFLAWNKDIKCVNNLHDEVTYEIRDEDAVIEYCVHNVQKQLETAFKLRVPLVAEPKLGKNWLETK